MSELRFFVPGIAAPGGSKRAFVPLNPHTKQPYRSKKTGRIVVNVIDDAGQRNNDWRSAVVMAGWEAMKKADIPPLAGPIELELIFRMPRPKFHFRSDGTSLRPSAPQHHITKPDRLKLARSTEDALTGVAWRDDAQIVRGTIEKVYSDQPGAWIVVRDIE